MREFTRFGLATGLATLLALGLASCGGSGGGSQAPRISYDSVVSFGDSLSDPGAYKVGPVAAAGGGLFTVNGITGAIGSDPAPSYTWAQLVAAAAVGTPSCAARTGGFGVGVSTVTGCTNYAQGGSRVSNSAGTGYDGANGPMTEQVVLQVTHYLNSTGGRFTGRELVTVQGGANDLFAQSGTLATNAQLAGAQAGAAAFVTNLAQLLAAGATNPATAAPAIATALATEAAREGSTDSSIVAAGVTAAVLAGNTAAISSAVYGPMVITASSAATTAGLAAAASYVTNTGAPIAIAGMVTAAVELGNSVKGMVSNGATRVVVTNLPDVSLTPYALALDSSSRQLVSAMTQAFNARLSAELAGAPGVLFVDVYTENQRQVASPSQFGLSNVTTPACATGPSNPSGTSLLCNSSNLIAGDNSRYLFADGVHPTPYGHKLLSQLVVKQLVLAGWL